MKTAQIRHPAAFYRARFTPKLVPTRTLVSLRSAVQYARRDSAPALSETIVPLLLELDAGQAARSARAGRSDDRLSGQGRTPKGVRPPVSRPSFGSAAAGDARSTVETPTRIGGMRIW
jgi:hypothetical protein